jgi:hypothetical protein
MVVFAYQRLFTKTDRNGELRTDYSENIEELLVHYRREKKHQYFKNFLFFRGELAPIDEVKLVEI